MTWAAGAPPYLIDGRPVFMVMAAAALQYPDGVLYPIEKMEGDFQYRRNGAEFEDLDHEHVRVYW